MKTYGYALIELVIIIVLLGALGIGIILTINPLQVLYQNTDLRVKQDVGKVYRSMQSFYKTRQYYPSAMADLVSVAELDRIPVPPVGYAPYTVVGFPQGCTTDHQNCTQIVVGGQIKGPATAGNSVWCWHSNTKIAAEAKICIAP